MFIFLISRNDHIVTIVHFYDNLDGFFIFVTMMFDISVLLFIDIINYVRAKSQRSYYGNKENKTRNEEKGSDIQR